MNNTRSLEAVQIFRTLGMSRGLEVKDFFISKLEAFEMCKLHQLRRRKRRSDIYFLIDNTKKYSYFAHILQ